MRLHVVFLDSCGWGRVESRAASIVSAALLLSHGIRRDAGVYVVLRCGGAYEWLYVDGGRVRNLRPDAESARGLLRVFLAGRGGSAARRGSGLPGLGGRLVEVRVGRRLGADPSLVCGGRGALLYNHRGEYGAEAGVELPRPPRLPQHQVAMANVLLDRACMDAGHY
ncbi:MAG: hypothetical protein QI199_04415 [Candidatus Korarchaeota archaeon]|nr:hypothetical protein [Candidatus Korarchaeota archaeon]